MVINLNENVTLHFEPMYLQKGAKQNFTDPSFGNAEFRFKGDIVEAPVFLKLDINAGSIHPYLMAGPTVGFIVNSTLEIAGPVLSSKEMQTTLSKPLIGSRIWRWLKPSVWQKFCLFGSPVYYRIKQY